MANTNLSPNMNLPVPGVGIDPGPQWASDLNSCLTLVDQHNHTSGSGVQITPAGLNINSDLPLNNNNLTLARSLRMQVQGATLSGVSDKVCLYAVGVDLYFNDGNGNVVRVTQSGGIAGSPGSISNLTSPASATYVSANQTFVWQSAANTPASLDAGSVVLRNIVANSKGLTLSPPASMGSNYTITLPSLPAQTNILTIDANGNIGASMNVDNASIQINGSNQISIKNQGVLQAMKAPMSFSPTQQIGSIGNIAISPCSNEAFNASSSPNPFINGIADSAKLKVTITTTGRPVFITLTSAGYLFNLKFTISRQFPNYNPGIIFASAASATTPNNVASGFIWINRNSTGNWGTVPQTNNFGNDIGPTNYSAPSTGACLLGPGTVWNFLSLGNTSGSDTVFPISTILPTSICAYDFVPAGTYTYGLSLFSAESSFSFYGICLAAWEI